jgi:hypothetical protein
MRGKRHSVDRGKEESSERGFLSDIMCIRSIDPDWCIHLVFCSTLPFKVLPFRCVILKYPCLHVTPQHMFNNFIERGEGD